MIQLLAKTEISFVFCFLPHNLAGLCELFKRSPGRHSNQKLLRDQVGIKETVSVISCDHPQETSHSPKQTVEQCQQFRLFPKSTSMTNLLSMSEKSHKIELRQCTIFRKRNLSHCFSWRRVHACKAGNARLTTIPFKTLFDQVLIRYQCF